MRLARRFSLLATTLCTVLPSLSVAETTETTATHRKVSHQHAGSVAGKSVAQNTAPPAATASHKKNNTKALYATDVETVNVSTGTHSTNRKARQSTSPVTVVSAATLRRSGQVNLADSLVRTYASINVQAMAADSAALTSSIQMRGLNPNEVLVLVDGKRRHSTANIVADAGPQFGSTGVDLNMIPANAIDHIEVLERFPFNLAHIQRR